ncbi:DUF4236 domain-containing protein [Pseudomonas sp.]|uniref:DUF4236 domain-containing protein n=1 Tax=Pseudomonas sp. TaxID=306 RepID=UPI003D130C6E
MAFRIRKSFKIAPGLRINISKSGVSTSVGGRGLTANLSKRGTRITAGLPGSGFSASKLYKTTQQTEPVKKTLWIQAFPWVLIGAFLWWLF